MSFISYTESAIFQTPDAGAGPNVDFNTGDVDPAEYPDFHQHMVDEGWDHMDASGRAAAVNSYVGGVVVGNALRAQQTYGWSDYETMMAMGGWSGYSEREIREKWGPKPEPAPERRPGLLRLAINTLFPF